MIRKSPVKSLRGSCFFGGDEECAGVRPGADRNDLFGRSIVFDQGRFQRRLADDVGSGVVMTISDRLLLHRQATSSGASHDGRFALPSGLLLHFLDQKDDEKG
jgi:hypothetical protein